MLKPLSPSLLGSKRGGESDRIVRFLQFWDSKSLEFGGRLYKRSYISLGMAALMAGSVAKKSSELPIDDIKSMIRFFIAILSVLFKRVLFERVLLEQSRVTEGSAYSFQHPSCLWSLKT